MKILSFDCADKTFGYSMIEDCPEMRSAIFKEIRDGKMNENNLMEFRQNIRDTRRLISYGFKDLLRGKKIKDTTRAFRTRMLKEYLDTLSTDGVDLVIIESQNMNRKSQVIENKLEMYYDIHLPSVKRFVIDAGKKGKVYYPKVGSRESFIAKYSTSHDGNKEHATQNFLFLSELYGWNLPKMTKGKINHIADACMQSIAYMKFLHTPEKILEN
jgi:hypothetical protein